MALSRVGVRGAQYAERMMRCMVRAWCAACCSQLVRRWVGPAHDGAKISLRSQVEHFVAPKLRPALIFGKLTWGLVTPFARVRRNPFAFASEEGWCEVFKNSRSAGFMRGLGGLG